MQPKTHLIESRGTGLPSIPIMMLILTLASIVLLGILGDMDEKAVVRAEEATTTTAP